jgi:hypothetical protein
MFTVKKKNLTPNMIWDVENNKPLCKFVKGVIETNDEALIAKLKELGHEVSGESDIIELEQTEQPKSENADPVNGTEQKLTDEALIATTSVESKRRSRK